MIYMYSSSVQFMRFMQVVRTFFGSLRISSPLLMMFTSEVFFPSPESSSTTLFNFRSVSASGDSITLSMAVLRTTLTQLGVASVIKDTSETLMTPSL